MKKLSIISATCVGLASAAFILLDLVNTNKLYTDKAYIDAYIITIESRVDADVKSISIKENQLVNEGDNLVLLDSFQKSNELKTLYLDLDKLKTQQDKLKEHLNLLKQEKEIVLLEEEGILTELELGKQQEKRQRSLSKQNLSSIDVLESIEYSNKRKLIKHRAIQAEFSSISTRGKILSKDIDLLQIDIESKKLLIERCQSELKYYTFSSPSDGVIITVLKQPGEQVEKGDDILQILPDNNLWIEAYFDETLISDIHLGMEANISLDAYPSLKLKGAVSSISPIAGAKFNLITPNYTSGYFTRVVQRVPVRVTINDLDLLPNILRPGLSAKVSLNAFKN